MRSSKFRENLLLFICTILFIILTVAIIKSNQNESQPIYIGKHKLETGNFSGVLNSVQSLICMIMVLLSRKKGHTISVILISISIITTARAMIDKQILSPLPGITSMIITLATVGILANQLRLRQHEIVTDYLTDLKNRRGIIEILNSKVCGKNSFYLLYLDLDDFKLINDNLGHKAGDKVLKITAQRMKAAAGKKCTISRIGGDEFVILIPDGTDIQKKSEEIIKSISSRIVLDQNGSPVNCYINASAGISCFPKDSQDSEDLLKYADIAMYNSKRSGKNQFCFFSTEMEKIITLQSELELKIKEGLENNLFYLVYQPQYKSYSKGLRGFEALLRLKDKNGNDVNPADFVPVAEMTDLILKIDEYVLNMALSQFAKIVIDSGNSFTLSVNISAKNICSYGFADKVKSAVQNTSFPPECLEIEITEYCFVQSLDNAIENIKDLKSAGIQIALDDFGTGFSSLSNLSKLPVDLLKIDKSFVDDIEINKVSSDFINAVISMGHLLGCKVISEGVENDEQLSLLRLQACDYIQGFVWSRPLEYNDAVRICQSA